VPHDLPLSTIAIGVATSAIFGVLAIRLLLGMLRHKGFGVFFAYRAALALGVLGFWLAKR
jgi:undecaprenyl pyrophosphate phosphatase UppP